MELLSDSTQVSILFEVWHAGGKDGEYNTGQIIGLH